MKKPVTAGLIIALFCFGFIIIYKPLGTQAGKHLNYYFTMAVYSLSSGIATILSVILIRLIKWFSQGDWNVLKELVSNFLIMSGIGVVIYIMGFFLEEPSIRWNIATFLNSVYYAILLSIIPFSFFTLSNFGYLFPEEYQHTHTDPVNGSVSSPKEIIQISSQLKKESLSFLPAEFIYAESEGNYVVFYLSRNNQVKKEIIRNSINSIEQQLSPVPYFLRTHRAFIVNLKKVTGRHGTTLGYKLRLEGTETRIPVSRTNTKKFNTVFTAFKD